MDKNKKTVQAYDKNSQYYADKFDSYNVRIDDIDRALKLNKSGSNLVMEIGCGNGRDAQYIISKVGVENYLGIDASEGLVKLCKQKVSGGTFHVQDMRELDVSNETYGVIISFASVLHVNHDELAKIIKDCHKWLKIGGILYISTKYGEYKEIEIENLADIKYYYSYTPENIKMMADIGFETIYSVIGDSEYGPTVTIAFKKV
jgi:SAM-dependent methyltransferase